MSDWWHKKVLRFLLDAVSLAFSDEGCKKILRALELFFIGFVSILIVVGIVFLGIGPEPQETRTGKIIGLLNDNWKVMLILLIPIFYVPVKAFIERSRYGPTEGYKDVGETLVKTPPKKR